MNKHIHKSYLRFSGAFFNTAEEKHLKFNIVQRQSLRCALAGMRHYYRNTDEFHQIRNGEKLAVNLSRKQGKAA